MKNFLQVAFIIVVTLILVNVPSYAGWSYCEPCHGSGKCSICRGMGVCPVCGGKGMKSYSSICCMACKGSGKCTSASYYHYTPDGRQVPACINGNCGYCGGAGRKYYPY